MIIRNVATSLVLQSLTLCGIIAGSSAGAQDTYRGYKPDNTIQNTRDRDAANPTPQDQSNYQKDLKLTAKLRRAVVSERTLSMNAKNIKIIDSRGYVVLRGPVDSPREKEVINRIAQQYCGLNFRNELEVKSAK